METSFTETYRTTKSVNFVHCLILKKQCYVSGTGLVHDIHQVKEWGDNYFCWVWQKLSFATSGPVLHLQMGTDPIPETVFSLRQ